MFQRGLSSIQNSSCSLYSSTVRRFSVPASNALASRKFTKNHEWVKVEGSTCVVGLTEHLLEEIGNVSYIDLPRVGDTFNRSDSMVVVESSKKISDIYAPVSGVVVEVNEALKNNPNLINEDPFSEGWLVKIQIQNSDEIHTLLDGNSYRESIKKI